MHKPRIVHVINSLSTGGAETMLARLVGSADSPFDHIVLPLMGGGGVEARVRDIGVLAPPVGIQGAEILTAPFRLARRLQRLRPDLVQGWLPQANLAATVGTLLSRMHVPVLWNVRWTLYDLDSERLGIRMLFWMSARLGRSTERIIYNSRLAVPQHTAIGFPPDRAIVIPNGFDLGALRPDPEAREAVRRELGIPQQAAVVGMVARFHPMKDHVMSLHAAARILEQGRNVVFVYAGTGVDNANSELRAVIQRLGLRERVRLIGERRDVARLYASFDVYWMSSWARGRAEGFPNVVAEAMACGVPCVTTDVGEAAWLIGDTGRVVPPGDSRSLADAVVDVLGESPEELLELGRRARERIRQDFSLDSVVNQYSALYSQVLGLTH